MSGVGGLYSEAQVEHVMGEGPWTGGAGLEPCTEGVGVLYGRQVWDPVQEHSHGLDRQTDTENIGLVQRARTTNGKDIIKRVQWWYR